MGNTNFYLTMLSVTYLTLINNHTTRLRAIPHQKPIIADEKGDIYHQSIDNFFHVALYMIALNRSLSPSQMFPHER